MATKTFYFKDASPPGVTAASSLQDGGTVTSSSTTNQMQCANLDPAPVSGDGVWRAAVAASGFTFAETGATAAPEAILGSSIPFRSENTLTGTFAVGTWTVQFWAKGSSAGNAAGFNFRLYRSTGTTGTGAVEITTDPISTAFVTINSTGIVTSATPSLGSVSLSNEYLWIDVAWVEDTVPTVTNNINLWVGSANAFITTPDFSSSNNRFLAALGVGI